MSNDIVSAQISALLEQHGSYAAALAHMIAEHDKAQGKDAPATKAKSTVAGRKAAYRKALEEFDPEVLVPMSDTMQNYIDEVFTPANVDKPRALEHDEVVKLAHEYLDNQKIKELLAVRYEVMRTLMLMAIDEDLKTKGVDPETSNGRLEVPEVGKAFCKEGAGLTDPSIDEEFLKAGLRVARRMPAKSLAVPAQG